MCPRGFNRAARKSETNFTIEGLRRRCAFKHRNSRRETAGWDRVDHQEVFVLCWKAGPSPNVGSAKGSGREVLADGHKPTQLPALLISRLWFNSRMSSCHGGACAPPPSRCNSRQPHHFFCRLRVSTRPSLQNSAHSGRHGGSLPFSSLIVGPWQTSNALALQASLCGSVTHRLHHFKCRSQNAECRITDLIERC